MEYEKKILNPLSIFEIWKNAKNIVTLEIISLVNISTKYLQCICIHIHPIFTIIRSRKKSSIPIIVRATLVSWFCFERNQCLRVSGAGKNVVSLRSQKGLMRLWCRGDGREKVGNVARSKGGGTCTHGAEVGAEILFSCTVTRTRLSRVLQDWFSSGAFVILSSTSSSQNFLVPRTPGREKDKEDPSGACLHPSRDFRAAWVLAERLTFAFSEWVPGNRAPFNQG